MEKKVLFVSITAASFGLLSTILAFAAEAKRIKASQIIVDIVNNTCDYPNSPSFALGFLAAIALLIALIIISVASGCFCCCRGWSNPSDPNCECNLLLLCFIFSWIIFVPAFLMLISAASFNNSQSMEQVYSGTTYCTTVRRGVFSIAAALSFFSVSLGIFYYLQFSSRKSMTGSRGTVPSNGIAMGHPQVPPTTHEPAFVHEDTYMRRQFT